MKHFDTHLHPSVASWDRGKEWEENHTFIYLSLFFIYSSKEHIKLKIYFFFTNDNFKIASSQF